MAYTGQPVPTTEYQIPVAKISDGKSVVVTATGNVVQGDFYEIEGFFGVAMTNGKAGDKVVLNIEQAEYETDQINTSEAFNKGDLVYFDAANERLTTSNGGGANRKVGRVTVPKDVNNVIWFILGPQF